MPVPSSYCVAVYESNGKWLKKITPEKAERLAASGKADLEYVDGRIVAARYRRISTQQQRVYPLASTPSAVRERVGRGKQWRTNMPALPGPKTEAFLRYAKLTRSVVDSVTSRKNEDDAA